VASGFLGDQTEMTATWTSWVGFGKKTDYGHQRVPATLVDDGQAIDVIGEDPGAGNLAKKESETDREVTDAIPTAVMDCEVIYAIPTTGRDQDVIHLVTMVARGQAVKTLVAATNEMYGNIHW